jgi:hypothetical protein
MLAYLDGILDPEDAEDIGRRIEKSEKATNLLHRTRDVMRRLRLAAPSLADRGPGLDPNTVAEYLDNTLHDTRVNDFEKICLDSDIHLAEVASCHQILTIVLGEAAEIDPATRQRIYQLASVASPEAETPPVSAGVETSSGNGESGGESGDKSAEPKPRHKPTIPDYLREPRRRRRLLPLAIALATVACVAIVVLGALGQFKSGTRLGDALASVLRSDQAGDEGAVEPGTELAEQPGTEAIKQPTAGPAKQPKTQSTEPPKTQPTEPPKTQPPEPPKAQPTEPPKTEHAEPPKTEQAEPTKTEPGEQPKTKPGGQPKVVPVAQPPIGVGALMSDERQVLLRFNPGASHWERVLPQGLAAAGEKLLALPTYRPLLALMSAGVTIQLVGGTRVELLPTDSAGAPGLRVDYGQLTMRSVGKAGARLRLRVGNRSGTITFADAESFVALEVIPVHLPGTDPEVNPGSLVADVYAKVGQVLWEEGADAQTMQIPAGSWVMLSDQATRPPAPVKEFPKWVAGEDMNRLEKGADRLASETMARELQVDRSLRFGAGLVLMELNEHSRPENRWLAARCLGYIGDFGPLVASLNDPDYPPVRTDESIEHLRAAVARSPQTAAGVRDALEKQYGQDAPKLYRMLWGYTKQGLKDNREAEGLVEDLGDETLAVRTLSFWNLRDTFGLGLLYRPTDREPIRRAHAQAWKRRLESGELWSRLPGEGRAALTEKTPPPKTPPPKTAEQQP